MGSWSASSMPCAATSRAGSCRCSGRVWRRWGRPRRGSRGRRQQILSRLAHLDAQVASAESSLGSARREAEVADLAELVSTAEGLRARASGLAALLAERGRGVERDRLAAVDHDVVSSLEAEAASLKEQLALTELSAQELLPVEAELAAAETALERECQGAGRPGTGARAPAGCTTRRRGPGQS